MDLTQRASASRQASLPAMPVEMKCAIVNYMDEQSMARLMRCNKDWRNLCMGYLYKKNATEGNSSAINKVAMSHPRATEVAIAKIVIARSVHYGGNVNAAQSHTPDDFATPMHIAAALGKIQLVEILLSYGARVNTLAMGLLKLKGLDHLKIKDSVRDQETISAITSLSWYPLLMPLVTRNEPMIRLLIRAGASPSVTGHQRHVGGGFIATPHQGDVTVAHILAATSREELSIGSPEYFHLRSTMNSRLPYNGSTPAHIAITTLNSHMFDEVASASANADLNIPGVLGRTPLLIAITEIFKSRNKYERAWFLDCFNRLIALGANLDAVSHQAAGETPLIAVLKGAEHDWPYQAQYIKTMMTALIDNGANPNGQAMNGSTPLVTLASMIMAREGNSSLERLLITLIARGASVNRLLPSGASLIKHIVAEKKQCPDGLIGILMQAGAVVPPWEANSLCLAWARLRPFRKIYEKYQFDMWRYVCFVGQRILNEMFKIMYCENDWQGFLGLRARYECTIIEELIVLTVQGSVSRNTATKCKIFDELFEEDHAAAEGQTLLHLVLKTVRLATGESDKVAQYFQNVAVSDAKKLLRKDASVFIPNDSGITVYQLAHTLGRRYSKLRKLIIQAGKDEKAIILDFLSGEEP